MKSLDLDRLDFLEYLFGEDGAVCAEVNGVREDFDFDDLSMMITQENDSIWIEPLTENDSLHEMKLKGFLEDELDIWLYQLARKRKDIDVLLIKAPNRIDRRWSVVEKTN